MCFLYWNELSLFSTSMLIHEYAFDCVPLFSKRLKWIRLWNYSLNIAWFPSILSVTRLLLMLSHAPCCHSSYIKVRHFLWFLPYWFLVNYLRLTDYTEISVGNLSCHEQSTFNFLFTCLPYMYYRSSVSSCDCLACLCLLSILIVFRVFDLVIGFIFIFFWENNTLLYYLLNGN